jgi:oxalate---CoA ligase
MLEEISVSAFNPAVQQTAADVFRMRALQRPQGAAIVFPNRVVVTYEALQQQIDRVGTELKRAGIGVGDWVAIVMPDGPELAVIVAAVACHATALPLNPTLTASELDDLFAINRLKAVILSNAMDGPAGAVAAQRGLCQLIATSLEGSTRVALRTPPAFTSAKRHSVDADDAAFILRTSGTTARPKLVPVTHRNLLVTAAAIQKWFALTPDDRVLCVMPLYYALGLRVALFTSLLTGGSVSCPARSSESDVLTGLTDLAPTWYSAGPTLHRAVLERARSIGRGGFRHSLRFVHSGAAPLPDAVHDGLEEVFDVPVLQTYGLSEAGLVAANSATLGGRKRGTVGRRRPDELAIRSEDGRILAADELGEIVVRGPAVTPGYIDDTDANRSAFADGWFCTGDLGSIDADGFLTVAGRVKELINRGGEKIVPAEIDAALLNHPAVAEAAAFPLPHPRLGEDVAAAVVLRPGKIATSLELRRFLRATLVPFKIPRRILIVDTLPKGETGKVRRRDLSGRFGAESVEPSSSPWGSPLEIEIAEIWQRLLERKGIGRDDEFFEMGGDSLLAVQMLLEVERLTGRVLPESILFETATIRQLAESVVQSDTDADQTLLVELHSGTGRPPFFFVDGDFWGGGYYTRKIARLLGPEQPFYSLRSHGLRGDSIPTVEQMAQDYLPLIAAVRPHGPYRLGGHCNGALIALELARRLEAAGERVELLAMVEPITLNARPSMRLVVRTIAGTLGLVTGDRRRRDQWLGFAMSIVWRAVRKTARVLHERGREPNVGDSLDVLTQRIAKRDPQAAERFLRLQIEYRQTMARYLPGPVATRLLCVVAESHERSVEFTGDAWRHLASRTETAIVPGDHMTCITTHAEALVSHLRERFAALDRATDSDTVRSS